MTKEFQKDREALKRKVHQVKKEASGASNQWEKKYVSHTVKYKKENVEMKIQLQAKKIEQVEMSNEHQTLQSAFQYLQKDFARQRKDFDAFYEEYRRHAAQREELIEHLWMVSED